MRKLLVVGFVLFLAAVVFVRVSSARPVGPSIRTPFSGQGVPVQVVGAVSASGDPLPCWKGSERNHVHHFAEGSNRYEWGFVIIWCSNYSHRRIHEIDYFRCTNGPTGYWEYHPPCYKTHSPVKVGGSYVRYVTAETMNMYSFTFPVAGAIWAYPDYYFTVYPDGHYAGHSDSK